MSRLNTRDEGTHVEDSFPNEHLFEISTHTPCYAHIANYLATGKVPQHFPYKEKQKIIHHSVCYSWIEGYLIFTWFDQQIWCPISGDDIYDVLNVAHDGPYGGNFSNKQTCHKLL